MSVEAITELTLGESRETFEVEGLEHQHRALAHMISQARRTVDVVSRDLDRRLFDRSDVVEHFRRLALDSSRARVRLLIIDTGPLSRQEHRLVTLVKRLPTFFEVRQAGPDHRSFSAAYVIADMAGYIYRPQSTLYAAEVSFHDPVRADELTRQFDRMWELGTPDVNLRQMRI